MAQNVKDNFKKYERMSDFYHGKSILLTGSAGFLGSVILEVLLRCFPGIQKIYILLRQRKGLDLEARKNLIFKKKLFRTWLPNHPEAMTKVEAVAGDLCLPNMGLSDKDLEQIAAEVTIVFHCAASISFLKPLKYTVLQNSLGTKHALEVCRKLKKLEALVYTSTAYSFSNYYPYIEEKVYRLPFPAQRFLNELENGTDESFEALWKMCKPEWPNYYSFSKGLAENILQDCASDLPIAIIRPSIICMTYKTGYVEEGNGLVDFGILIGKGYLRVCNGAPEAECDLVPLDIVANTHIVAAWSLANSRCPNPLIVNTTGGHIWTVPLKYYCESVVKFVSKNNNTIPNSFQCPSVKVIKNKVLYWIHAIYEHYIPAVLIEVMLRFKKSKLRMLSQYIFYDNIQEKLFFFSTNTFNFEITNINKLSKQIHPAEKELIYLDFDGICLDDVLKKLKTGSTIFDWNNDKKSIAEREKLMKKRYRFLTFVKNAAVLLFIWIAWLILRCIL